MADREPIYDRPCSKCGRYRLSGEKADRLGDLADHRVCIVPDSEPTVSGSGGRA